MQNSKRGPLVALLVVLFLCVIGLQTYIGPIHNRILQKERLIGGGKANSLMVELPGQFIAASFTGFRQVIAGALWIRADDFFHRGQYQAIIPLVRMVTWLDPHDIDVYTTGAWHLDYNFVDEANSLSDKRYIPAAVALMKEGIRNNPETWDLYFELGWTHYSRKLLDEQKALYYIAQACKHNSVDPNTGEESSRPEYVDRMLAHELEKVGRFDDAIKQWYVAKRAIRKAMLANKKHPGSGGYADQGSLILCDRNLSLLLMRLGWRYGRMDDYEKGLKIAESVSGDPAWVEATKSARQDFERRKGKKWVGDAQKPLNTNFQVSWLRVAPQVIIIKGKVNIIPASEYKGLASEAFTHWYAKNATSDAARSQGFRDGSRVYWRLEDYDYKMPDLQSFSWKTDLSKTVAWGDIYVGGGSFSSRIDMGDPRDREMYPFKAKKYKLTVWLSSIDPGIPDYVQDRVGWKGEAFSDKCLDTTSQPGFKILKKEFILSRSDII